MVLHGSKRVRTRGRIGKEGSKFLFERRTTEEHVVGVSVAMEIVELVTECEQFPIGDWEVVDRLAIGSRVGSRGERRGID